MKRLLSLALVIGVLAAAIGLSRYERSEEAPATPPPSAEDRIPAAPSSSKLPVDSPAPGDIVESASERQVAAGDSTLSDEPNFSFLVVDGRSGQPIADAEVCWMVPTLVDTPGSPWEDWVETFLSASSRDLAFLEQETRSAGRVTRSGPDGRVVLPQVELPRLFVRSGNLVGGSCTLDEHHSGTTLRLYPDGDLCVRVLDAAGGPCANVGVRLLSSFADYGLDSVELRVTAGPDGLARLPYGHAIVASSDAKQAPTRQAWRVEVETLPGSDARHSLDASALPVEPITIRLPPTGAVELLIRDQQGRPLASDLPAVLVEADAENTLGENGDVRLAQPMVRNRPGQLDATIQDGKVVFEHVGLGRNWLACAVRNRASRVNAVRFAGPTAPGERIRVELVVGADSVVLTGRAVDPDGKALREADLRFSLFSLPSPNRVRFANRTSEDVIGCLEATLSADARGSFCVEYPLDAAYGGRPEFVVAHFLPDASRWEVSANLEAVWTPGVHDLGDLRLARPPILAAGVVVDENGAPVAGAHVEIAVFKGAAETRGMTNDRGEFELRSAEPHSDVALYSRKVGFAPASQRRSAPGFTDWRLVLRHATRIVARLKPPAGTSCREFCISLHQTDYTGGETAPNISSSLGDDGEFEWDECPPGTYVMDVRMNDRGLASLVRIDNVVARPGETTDVGWIDLSGDSRVVTVSALGLDGEPLEQGFFLAGSDDGALISSLWSSLRPEEIEQGKLRLVREGDVLHVAIAAPETRAQVFHDVRDGDTLRMQPGIPVSISITNPVSRPPEGSRFLVALVRADLDRRALAMTRLAWYRGEVDAQGVATLRAPGPGRYVLRWILERTFPGGSQGRDWPDEKTIEVVDRDELQRFEVRCPIDPATAWDEK